MALRFPICVAIAGMVAACTSGSGTGGVVTTKVDYAPLYRPSVYQWVAAGRDVPVVIFGDPTPAPPDIWNRVVTDAMNATSWVDAGHFTTTPDGTERGNFFIALAFGATSTMTGAMACAGQIDPDQLGPVGGRTAIVGAFCNNARAVTTARVAVNAIAAPDAPQLQPAIDQLLVKLLPRRDPNRSGRPGRRWLPG
jgi:hypothetical protein